MTSLILWKKGLLTLIFINNLKNYNFRFKDIKDGLLIFTLKELEHLSTGIPLEIQIIT